jgi:hypothetical protein
MGDYRAVLSSLQEARPADPASPNVVQIDQDIEKIRAFVATRSLKE